MKVDWPFITWFSFLCIASALCAAMAVFQTISAHSVVVKAVEPVCSDLCLLLAPVPPAPAPPVVNGAKS